MNRPAVRGKNIIRVSIKSNRISDSSTNEQPINSLSNSSENSLGPSNHWTKKNLFFKHDNKGVHPSIDVSKKKFLDTNIPENFKSRNSNNAEINRKKKDPFQISQRCCCMLVAAVLAGILLAVIVAAVTIIMTESTTTTAYPNTTTSTVTTTTPTTETTTSSTSTTTRTTSSSPTSTSSSTSTSTSSTSSVSSTTTSKTTTSKTTTSATTTSTTTTTTVYDSCNNLRWSQTGVVVAGSPGATDGTASNQLKQPNSFYIDENNTLYICDTGNNRIQKWIVGATNGSTVAGSSTGNHGTSSYLLDTPLDITFDQNGFMYVVDQNNARVQCFPPNSTTNTTGTTVAGTGSHGNSYSQLDHPTTVDIDDNFNLYIADTNNKRVMQWAPNATSGIDLISSNNLDHVYDILLSPNSSNQVYMSDGTGNVIYLWTFNASNQDLTLSQVNSHDNQLTQPEGMAFDPYGNLYVADQGKTRVVMYCSNSVNGTLMVNGTVVINGTSSTPILKKPLDVAFDLNLNMYVLDHDSDQVIQFPRL